MHDGAVHTYVGQNLFSLGLLLSLAGLRLEGLAILRVAGCLLLLVLQPLLQTRHEQLRCCLLMQSCSTIQQR